MPVSPWYENPLFLSPIFGFLGVIVGGLITAGSSYFLEKQREKREVRREERIRGANIRTAARLIELDFRSAASYLNVCVKNKQWSTILEQPPSFQSWEKHRESLAPEISQADWIALLVAARAGEQLAKHFHRAQQRRDKAMSDEEVKHFVNLYMKSFAEAQRVLLQLVGTKNVEAQINVAEESPPEH